jgi:hypothetical protein
MKLIIRHRPLLAEPYRKEGRRGCSQEGRRGCSGGEARLLLAEPCRHLTASTRPAVHSYSSVQADHAGDNHSSNQRTSYDHQPSAAVNLSAGPRGEELSAPGKGCM